MLDVVEMRVCTTTKEPHSLYLGLFAWCRHVNVAKFVTPPCTAVLRSRGGVTHSGETRLIYLYKYIQFQNQTEHAHNNVTLSETGYIPPLSGRYNEGNK